MAIYTQIRENFFTNEKYPFNVKILHDSNSFMFSSCVRINVQL